MNKRTNLMTVLALAVTGAVLGGGTAQAQVGGGSSLDMTADQGTVAVGEPVTFTITKTNPLPPDNPNVGHDWSVRDFLPADVEFVSAEPSQGECALYARADLGIPDNPQNGGDSDVVQCDLGSIPSGDSATIDVTVTPDVAGDITNIAADLSEATAEATVTVE